MKKKTGLKSKPTKAKHKPVKPHKVITIKAPVKAPVTILVRMHPEDVDSARVTQKESDSYWQKKRYH